MHRFSGGGKSGGTHDGFFHNLFEDALLAFTQDSLFIQEIPEITSAMFSFFRFLMYQNDTIVKMEGVPLKLKWASPAFARKRPSTEHSQSVIRITYRLGKCDLSLRHRWLRRRCLGNRALNYCRHVRHALRDLILQFITQLRLVWVYQGVFQRGCAN